MNLDTDTQSTCIGIEPDVLMSKWDVYISSPAHKVQEHCGREDRYTIRATEAVVFSDTVFRGYIRTIVHINSQCLELHVPWRNQASQALSLDQGGAHEVLYACDKLLSVDGCWGRVTFYQGCGL